ncbi:DUF222 domain-containing protein [Kutzneria chonburiensis]|uniref:DUF222 domain-containing protein n=1 Tax=Kutzneria chonburiensis TaxID=1483604 RepID=A0ABV6N569_9PSEU
MEEPSNESALLLEALNLTEGGRTVSELIEMMRKLVCLESEVRAAMSHVVAVATSQGVPESTGHSSAAELLKSEFHLSGREASELAVSAIRLRDQLPCTYVALRSGLITWSHATTLVRAVDRLGFGTVQGAEHDWIELIATRTSPEALQRVVNARRLEHDGYSPRTAPRPQPGADPLTPTDTSTTVSEATTFNNASEATDTPRSDIPTQHDRPDGTVPEPPSELSDRRKVAQPAHGEAPGSEAATEPVWPVASATTLSGDTGASPYQDSTMPNTGCVHPDCAAGAALREISFTVHWLDGGQSTVLGRVLICDEHATALTNCPVDQIRVGHSSTIWTIKPSQAPAAA